jgi:hypothetical protein
MEYFKIFIINNSDLLEKNFLKLKKTLLYLELF